MKPKDQLFTEAEAVLEVVGEKIKTECSNTLSSDDINSVTNLVDSYCRLFELLR